jgi:hypothetical protein
MQHGVSGVLNLLQHENEKVLVGQEGMLLGQLESIGFQPAHGRFDYFQLQPPPGAQPLEEIAEPPLVGVENVESISSTLRAPHFGQTTSESMPAVFSNFSNLAPHSRH